MLTRLISLTGLVFVFGIMVPVAQQARSGYLPPTIPLANLTDESSTKIPLPAPESSPLKASPQAISANSEVTSSALAVAPQSQDVHLEIHLQRREVLVYQGESLVKRYPIGIGRAGWETPVGTFEVRQMREHPVWISPFNGQRIPSGDARNPMGTRWIGFWTDGNNWIGFHGTRNPNTVGRNSSHGCLHMHRADLEDLYRQVKLGTSVTVRQ